MSKQFIYLPLFMIFTGCAFVPTTELEKFPVNDLTKYRCSTILVKIAVAAGYDFEFAQLSYEDLTDKNNYYKKSNSQTAMFLDRINSTNAFKLWSNDNKDDDYLVVGFSWDEEDHNWGWGDLSILSLGIIPSKMDYDIVIKAKVFTSKGKLLHSYTANKLKVDQYNGFFLLPFVPWNKAVSRNQIFDKVAPLMADELIEMMIKDKVLKCEKSYAGAGSL